MPSRSVERCSSDTRRGGRHGRRPPLRIAAAIACLALFVGGLAGCGQSAQEEVSDVVESYFDALSTRDYAQACARIAPPFERELAAFARRRFEDRPPQGCERILAQIGADNDPRLVELQGRVEVREVTIRGDGATARLSSPNQRARVVREGDRWLIADLDFGPR